MLAAPFVALTEYDYALMLARLAAPSGRARCAELLASAIRAAERLEMRALRERAGALHAALQSRSPGSHAPRVE